MIQSAGEQIIYRNVNVSQADRTGGLIAHYRAISVTRVRSILHIRAGRCAARIEIDADDGVGAPYVGDKGILDGALDDVFGRADVHIITVAAGTSGLISKQIKRSIQQSGIARV